MTSSAELKESILKQSQLLGFSRCGFTHPGAIKPAAPRLSAFLKASYHGQMTWLSDRAEWRGNPEALWPDAKSIIMLAESYTPDHDPREDLEKRESGTISVYAGNRDYHDLLKKRLKRLGRWLVEKTDCEIKVFVDTAPVMEKPLAAAAGLGWQGKHTNLVSRELGNWFFLGSIFTTLEIEPDDQSESDHCGSCRSCLEICPTDAFPAPYQLDARRCISYLTIEHKGPVPIDLRRSLGNRIYGCDDCLAVCPWNKFAQQAHEIGYRMRPQNRSPALAKLAQLDDAAFRQWFSGSSIKRIGRNRFIRNVLYAIGNSKAPDLRRAAAPHLEDPDDAISDAAKWAIKELS